jgi:hypothetical protein
MLRQLDRKAVLAGLLAAFLLIAGIYVGSGGMAYFDPALIVYASASVFAAFAIVYRYSVWLSKPPTGLYWKRGWQLFLRPKELPANLVKLVNLLWNDIVAQTFIERRNHLRWGAHLLISWGCIVAAAVTFPLAFGWVAFEPAPNDPMVYQAVVMGVRTASFPSTSLFGWMTFHVLDFCAIAILVGMIFAMRRRMYDPGAQAVQQFGPDFLPLILLFSICVTGLMLTASSLWMYGHSYSFISLLHAFTVIVTLVYLPFGKFFHIFQRPAQLGVAYYKQEGERTQQAACRSCGQPFASLMHVEDLKHVLDDLGLNQRLPGGGHYQEVCPACRRKLLAVNQKAAIGGQGFL